MPQIDLTFTITGILAICSIGSSVVTTWLNNRHQEAMKELEYKHLERQEERNRDRDIYEGYIRSAGACIHDLCPDNLRDFGAHSSLLMYVVQDDALRADMLRLEKGIIKSEKFDRIDLLCKISRELRALRDTQ